ncbi:hypothetical protein J2TS6_53730 [Paenibacillus albilobatus]|uniref:Uncharacterized protein n=1 Tax=Paenibacillus albilobatus TaxID=2716884 RepID=A0A919XJT0_9BACL|nr:hypothetical protein [Paenibacillus albilobatus]GIO34232.1 hypothetical protein J2TS6_53730 [Paenibacillus albilobatus]
MKLIISFLISLYFILVDPTNPQAAAAPVMPCSLVLEPVSGSINEKGAALVYKVKLTPSFPRTSISIHAIHLLKPGHYGNYDTYEGFAFIANKISWRFKLYPTPEADSPTWSGRIDDITAQLEDSKIEVRLSDSKTGTLGPAVLSNNFRLCK